VEKAYGLCQIVRGWGDVWHSYAGRVVGIVGGIEAKVVSDGALPLK